MDNKIEELEKQLEAAQSKDRILPLQELAMAYKMTEPDKTEEFAQEALELAEKFEITADIARSKNIIGILVSHIQQR